MKLFLLIALFFICSSVSALYEVQWQNQKFYALGRSVHGQILEENDLSVDNKAIFIHFWQLLQQGGPYRQSIIKEGMFFRRYYSVFLAEQGWQIWAVEKPVRSASEQASVDYLAQDLYNTLTDDTNDTLLPRASYILALKRMGVTLFNIKHIMLNMAKKKEEFADEKNINLVAHGFIKLYFSDKHEHFTEQKVFIKILEALQNNCKTTEDRIYFINTLYGGESDLTIGNLMDPHVYDLYQSYYGDAYQDLKTEWAHS